MTRRWLRGDTWPERRQSELRFLTDEQQHKNPRTLISVRVNKKGLATAAWFLAWNTDVTVISLLKMGTL